MSDQPWNNDQNAANGPEGQQPPMPPSEATPPPPPGAMPPYGSTPPPPPPGAMPPGAMPPPQYGATPPPPGAMPPQYGATPPQYGATPPPGAASYGAAPPAAGPAPSAFGFPLAVWGKRVGSYLLDGLLAGVPCFVLYSIGGVVLGIGADSYNGVLSALGGFLMFLGILVFLAVQIWNYGYKQGTTGVSFGKSIMKLRLVGEETGAPIGFGMAVGRYFAHYIDSAICCIGFLFPLWDAKRQTIADKILHTLVLDVSSDPNAGQFQWTLK